MHIFRYPPVDSLQGKAPVIELTRDIFLAAVFTSPVAFNVANPRQSDQHSRAVFITQTLLNIVLLVQGVGNLLRLQSFLKYQIQAIIHNITTPKINFVYLS